MLAFDAVLCDLDGVLRHHDPAAQAALDERYGLAPGELLKLALAPETIGPALLGRVSDEQWLESVAEALGGDERARAIVAEFAAVPTSVDEEVRALLAGIQAHVPVVLVTNATTALEEALAGLGLAYFADEVVSSARVGVAKPDPRIYEIAAERAGVPAGRCLFVDDRAENVEAAVRLGMIGLHYTGPSALAAALAVPDGQ
ncbi:HAD-IA family hydrolase [Nonomuraea sp. NPDC050310]|uniref:HAD family hydrolase n=1 Tax=unclassified Nonomuraea TaxID=2593643 RepID=UPI003411B0B4